MKEFSLSNSWTLLTHEKCSVFADNNDRFVVLDEDLDSMLVLSTTEDSIEVHSCGYDLKHKVNISNRTFTLFYEPDEDEDE